MKFNYEEKTPVKGELRFRTVIVEKEHIFSLNTRLRKKSTLQQYNGHAWEDIPEDMEFILV